MEGLRNTWIDTLSYADARDIVKEKLVASVADFVAAGFFLKHIRDHELYKSAGYESIWDCAWAEFGLRKTSASRCMSFNDKYSLNGNSQDMDEKYLVYNKSQLQEMLYLSDEQLEQVSEKTTVREIRAIREEEQLPGQMSVEDYPELIPVATSQQDELYEEIEEDESEAELPELYEDDIEEQEEIIDGKFREIKKEDVKNLWKNNEGRKNWLKNFEAWGVWYKDENIGCTYYKYDLSDTDRIIAIKYPPVLFNGEEVFSGSPAYHLVKKGVKNISKYEDKERELIDYLAKIYRGEI